MPHIIFFFNLAIVWGMLWIEARRYRFYDAFRARVRMLEAHFLVPMVMENREMLQGEWKKLVCEDLILPSFKITKLEAVGRRLKRNYVFIFILIMVAWITKIFLHATAPVARSAGVLPRLAGRTYSFLARGVYLCRPLWPSSSASRFTSAKRRRAKFRNFKLTGRFGGFEKVES